MTTIKDIANSVGVSVTTVSRVLNNDPKFSVSEDTRNHIFQAAEKLAYRKKSAIPVIHNVSLLYWLTENEELEDVYFKQIRVGLEKECKRRNISIKKYNKADGVDAIDPKTSAFLMVGPFSPDEFKKVISISQIGVLVDTYANDGILDSVRPNLPLMIRQMIDYYIAQGHRKIGLICAHDYGMDRSINPVDTRERAFREYMQECRLLNERFIFHADTGSVSSGYQCAMRSIEQLGENLPTAFCVASDPLAVGTLQAFHEKGIAIPQRISFFSINDVNVSKYISPPLTTFHIDIPLMCDTALNLLEDRLVKRQAPQKTVLLGGTPIYRKSVREI